MSKSKTPSFILGLALKTTPSDERKLLRRFEAARQVYNACLGEAMKRLRLLRQSRAYGKACKMPKNKPMEKKARGEAFADARRAVGFGEYDLMGWATQFTYSWLRDHVASQEVKALVNRAFRATERYLYGTDRPCKKGRCTKKKKNCVACGRPRFKRYGEIDSVENITNLQGLRWRGEGNHVQWRDLRIPAIVDLDDPVQAHGLSCPVKYVRIVRKTIKGRNRFYAQLVLRGRPHQRTPVATGCVVGIDMGPSTIAAYDGTSAFLREFCAAAESRSAEKRRLQRHLDRQRRANNPGCYDEKGRAIKGKRPRNKSARMRRTEVRLKELDRQLAEHRKSLQGQMVNIILGMGNIVNAEKLSIKVWQRRWGKSVLRHAPGTFMRRLKQKCNDSGGGVREFLTHKTALSQTDHMTGKREKKPLSQRWHYFEDGSKVQRDLYSAFLAFCVDTETDTLDEALAKRLWACGAGSLLAAAFGDVQELAKGRNSVPTCFGLGQSQSESAVNLAQV